MPKLIYHDSDGVDKVINLGAEPLFIGRATECQIQTQDAMVSRRHARIIWDGNYWIEDLGSSNGVYVGNEKVQRAPFRPGDTVTCGSLVLRLMPDTSPRVNQAAVPAAPPPPAAPPRAVPAATLAPPPSVVPEIQIGPNAVLRGAVAPSHAATGTQNNQILLELEREKKRRSEAEEALLSAAERVKNAEARSLELEASAKEAGALRRKVDQLSADLKRLRGGKPPEDDTRDDADKAARRAAEAKRDELKIVVAELERRIAGASTAPKDPERDRLQRQVEQLTAELRRAKGGQGAPVGGGDSARIAELTEQLRQAQASSGANPAAADLAVQLGDSLAELRSSLRAAKDEAGLLTAPAESVQVVQEAIATAADQLEGARDAMRSLSKILDS